MKTLTRAGLVVTLLGTSALWAAAQSPAPFDMSGDRGSDPAPIATPAAPVRNVPGQPVAPFQFEPAPPAAAPRPIAVPANPPVAPPILAQPVPISAPAQAPVAVAPEPVAPAPAAPVAVAPVAVAPLAVLPPTSPAPGTAEAAPASVEPVPAGLDRRFIVPASTLRFEGEMDERSWAVYLTAGQATQPARLDVSFKSAIVVMPEASRLRISINNEPVLEAALSASETFRDVVAMVPPGLLQTGANTVRFQVAQRHRTDCTVESTYELWTDVDPSKTSLTFARGDAPRLLRGIDDLPAVGYDAKGVTSIHVIAPASNQMAIAPHLLRLVQALALAGNYPNPNVTVSDAPTQPDGDGALTVLLGVASEIDPILSQAPVGAEARPSIGFIDDPKLGSSVLVVSGASWSQIDASIDQIAASVDRPAQSVRTTLNTLPWLAPDVRFVVGKDRFRIADAGAGTQEFSGRRFHTEFAVGVPSDFYAESYGQATLLLDAAFTSAVRPASHLDIYVNGQIAATTRITRQRSGIFRQFPILIPLRHFRPGVNRVSINALLDTADDEACAPGGSTAGDQRFVLFDTTTFVMPNFARIGRRPNLAAFAGTASPYNRLAEPAAFVLGRADPKIFSAAASLVARMAIQSGRIVPLTPTLATGVGDRSAIFVGTAAQIPNSVIGQVGVSESIGTGWRDETGAGNRSLPKASEGFAPLEASLRRSGAEFSPAPLTASESENTDATFDRWSNDVSGGGWFAPLDGIEAWLLRTFDISLATFRIRNAELPAYVPQPKTTLILAQAASPNGGGTWTVLMAPSDESLISGIHAISSVERWREVSGPLTTYSATTDRIESRSIASYEFVQTQPFSFANWRLIAANWLSSNVLFYALGLVGLCIILGIVTTGLMRRLGRET